METAAQLPTYWFVGAHYGGTHDQTPRFLAEGVWENGYEDRLHDQVQSMRPGDRIAIKASYVRKHGLPFDSRGHSVSVMAIRATGTVVSNVGDGRRVMVAWEPAAKPREWYMFTNRSTVWRVEPTDWQREALIAFAFDGVEQDTQRFCEAPYWRDRYGKSDGEDRFAWTTFYEGVAEALLQFRSDRRPLVQGLHAIAARVPGMNHLEDQLRDGTRAPLADVCPFTAMGVFNRWTTLENRRAIASEFASLLGVALPVPASFDGVPFLTNTNSWLFHYDRDRKPGDIDQHWSTFEAAARYVVEKSDEARSELVAAFDRSLTVRGAAWNLTMGLYWAHPWDFPTLEKQSRDYLSDRLNIKIVAGKDMSAISGAAYLDLTDRLDALFQKPDAPVHSYPELSLAAWGGNASQAVSEPAPPVEGLRALDEAPGRNVEEARGTNRGTAYGVDDIVADGCFLGREHLVQALERLRKRKNLILQGPPGTGKTWLAKRLAFALMGCKDIESVRAVQFHPNLSYEDFVRGWRPSGDGRLALVDGVFMQAIEMARATPQRVHVVVIEEINRGNPAQIFGELLTLLEAGKRSPDDALEIGYPDQDGSVRKVYVPPNLHVIGTMNVADRSLALVDFALRRRFAYVELEPSIGDAWQAWVVAHRNIDPSLAFDIRQRMSALNSTIASDARLGRQFQVGHSYVTPDLPLSAGETREWFRLTVQTEIGPLLDEYWFDARGESERAREQLLEGW